MFSLGNRFVLNALPVERKAQRLDPITSLRFFAAAMIVIGHAHAIFGSWGIATAIPLEQGVSFFFVLSGFILTWNYPSLARVGCHTPLLACAVCTNMAAACLHLLHVDCPPLPD